MEEAVEICKLRLFLKLVAQLERYDQIEPLPDIGLQHSRRQHAGGFASLDAVRNAMTITPSGQYRAVDEEQQKTLNRIEEEARTASRAFDRFREQQTTYGGEATTADKEELRWRLASLRGELDRYLATEYGIDHGHPTAYQGWRASHRPFHWFVEFYGTMNKGGFDVVIGNPPYVARQNVAQSYTTKGFSTSGCPDITPWSWNGASALPASTGV